jgi:hypothetical protein
LIRSVIVQRLEQGLAKHSARDHDYGKNDEWSAQAKEASGDAAECGTEGHDAPRDGSKGCVHASKHSIWCELLAKGGVDDGPQSITDSEQDEARDSDITIRSESNAD